MYFVIDEISNLTDGGLFALVRFWNTKAAHDRGDPYGARESFSWPQQQPTEVREVTDGRGWLKRASDGVFVDPDTVDWDNEPEWETEVVQVDIPALIRGAVRAYWSRRSAASLAAQAWPVDHADHSIGRTEDDLRGLRGVTVLDMVGTGEDAGEVGIG